MHEKYIHALQLMDDTIASKDVDDLMHSNCDLCFNYIYLNFAEPNTSAANDVVSVEDRKRDLDLCRPLIDGTYKTGEMEDVLRRIPPILLDEVWPVAILRFMLRDQRLRIDHRKLKIFKEFYNRYSVMILNC